jgi:hypothetical protein
VPGAPDNGDYAGYLRVNGELRPLPIASTLDAQHAVFTWQPGPGFLGLYDLLFVRRSDSDRQEQMPVRVVVVPEHAPLRREP